MPDMVDRLIELNAANNRKLTAIIERLTKRNHALEQVIEQGIVLLEAVPEVDSIANVGEMESWLKRRSAFCARAKAILQGEDRKESE